MNRYHPFVDARVAYLPHTGLPGSAHPKLRPEPLTDLRLVRIFDARQSEADFSLDDSGFELVNAGAAGAGIRRHGASRTERLEAAASVVRRFTRARQVVAFGEVPAGNAPHHRLVHVDATPAAAKGRAIDLLSRSSDALSSRPWALINLWLPRGTVDHISLGLIHGLTLNEEDLVPTTLGYDQIYRVRFSRHHVWLYYPSIAEHQVLLLKTFDSRTDGRARYAFRSIFHNPLSPGLRSEATAIEVRTLALF